MRRWGSGRRRRSKARLGSGGSGGSGERPLGLNRSEFVGSRHHTRIRVHHRAVNRCVCRDPSNNRTGWTSHNRHNVMTATSAHKFFHRARQQHPMPSNRPSEADKRATRKLQPQRHLLKIPCPPARPGCPASAAGRPRAPPPTRPATQASSGRSSNHRKRNAPHAARVLRATSSNPNHPENRGCVGGGEVGRSKRELN